MICLRIKFLIYIQHPMVNRILFRILNGFVVQLIICSILKYKIIEKLKISLSQFKYTIGTNIHMVSKRDLKNQKINGDEVFSRV